MKLATKFVEAEAIIIKNKTNELGAPYLEIEKPKKIKITSQGTKFIYRNNHYETPLVGYHQAFNAVLALEACNFFLDNHTIYFFNNFCTYLTIHQIIVRIVKYLQQF